MSFFIAPSDDYVDHVTESMVKKPEFADRYDAIKELREQQNQGLVLSPTDAAKQDKFFRVASIQGPLESLAKLMDPEWMKDKARFYKWLDKHKQHVTYDRRLEVRPGQLTFSDGKVVL